MDREEIYPGYFRLLPSRDLAPQERERIENIFAREFDKPREELPPIFIGPTLPSVMPASGLPSVG